MCGAPVAYNAILNPAIGLANSLTLTMDIGKDGLKWIWLFSSFPFLGGLFAVIFYEFIFKKTQEVLNVDNEEGEDEDNLLDK